MNQLPDTRSQINSNNSLNMIKIYEKVDNYKSEKLLTLIEPKLNSKIKINQSY